MHMDMAMHICIIIMLRLITNILPILAFLIDRFV